MKYSGAQKKTFTFEISMTFLDLQNTMLKSSDCEKFNTIMSKYIKKEDYI